AAGGLVKTAPRQYQGPGGLIAQFQPQTKRLSAPKLLRRTSGKLHINLEAAVIYDRLDLRDLQELRPLLIMTSGFQTLCDARQIVFININPHLIRIKDIHLADTLPG